MCSNGVGSSIYDSIILYCAEARYFVVTPARSNRLVDPGVIIR